MALAAVAVPVAALVVVEGCELLKFYRYLHFLQQLQPDDFEAASKAAAAYPGHDTIVDRIVAWGTALRRN